MNHVLIVDDKEENLYYLRALLGGMGYSVTTARHGAEALVLARQSPPDVIVSDLLMPVMDGYTLLRHWKGDPRLKQVPFIVYTATYTEAEDEKLALNLGADAFILKPAEPEDFIARLREVETRMAASPRTHGPIGDEAQNLQYYSQTLIRKLEEKTLQLEEANQALQNDVAERKAVEASLRESEQRFRLLAENINEVFWITDPARTRMLYVSPAYERIWGRDCASLYAAPRSWLDAVHPEDQPRVAASSAGYARGDYDQTYRIARPDGTVRWIHDRAFPVRSAAGEILNVVGMAEDITERRQLEEQFRQAQKMEAIGQLAGGVAHDFNNILAAIMMQADFAAGVDNLPGEAVEFIDDIRAAAERAANLTRQLLAFSRRQVIQPRQLDLNEVVTSLTKMLERILGEDVRLDMDLHPGGLPIRADAGMLDQVLLNLVVNARDAMPKGGRIAIRTGECTFTAEDAAAIPGAAAGRYVCLRVADTGTGISPEALSHIFEPFFTTKEPGKGTGLGLATVFGIVRQHGGTLTVDSEPGKGAAFEIFLPAAEPARRPAPEPAARAEMRGGSETILLVEDEVSVRMITRALLERQGYHVLEATDGVEALRIWREHQGGIDLLFTDIVMPEGVTGRDLAARLQEGDAPLRVIFTSGYAADIAGRELSLRAGHNFLQKPYSRQQLLETVRRCLDGDD